MTVAKLQAVQRRQRLSYGLLPKQAGCCCCFAEALRVITASRPFPVVAFGSHAFCTWIHLEALGMWGQVSLSKTSFRDREYSNCAFFPD